MLPALILTHENGTCGQFSTGSKKIMLHRLYILLIVEFVQRIHCNSIGKE